VTSAAYYLETQFLEDKERNRGKEKNVEQVVTAFFSNLEKTIKMWIHETQQILKTNKK
jgi:hypothetical protein